MFLRNSREVSIEPSATVVAGFRGKMQSFSRSSQIGRLSCGCSGKSPSCNEESETPKSRTGFGTGISF